MKLPRILSLLSILAVTSAFAANQTVSLPDADAIKAKLQNSIGVKVIAMQDSPIKDLYLAMTDRGILYISKDGSKVLHGNMYDLNNRMKNLTEAAMAKPRVEQLKKFEPDMLVYKAKDEKHVITVFTDITCGYCRKLHNQMQEYNDDGITVRYLAFPRAGVPSSVASEMEAIWCAKDPLKAMTDAKAGKDVTNKSCNANIAQQYELGQSFGVNGTPAIVLDDGTLIPGYQPPEQLLKTIENH
ncbi:bifunctional protein-disulfide isomerase/oxidoreductase DsbC [Parashewanella spongiae]|uniref:Thiol:disulfide interchange protein n=1 Tax=Parashewanella spongiae TaxID=342950 RepID=A0A3A6UBI1_9GAMM|nr:bifunctional protein-disulfide isomerase/oxidoreductase DsbC [Parashewanella spongiae]MCL1076944.1 bifunctional protein-disulfide isomerase/oxidoreductase DsbC [Parashewanella spongiae]RJY18940.1 bifunctional protein-disulfide isomerase/oxidoreductase DsbC [Parashewanella spongiae]